MKKAILILALGSLVLSCSKKDTQTQDNSSDSLSIADTMSMGTMPEQADTMTMPADPADTSMRNNASDSVQTTR